MLKDSIEFEFRYCYRFCNEINISLYVTVSQKLYLIFYKNILKFEFLKSCILVTVSLSEMEVLLILNNSYNSFNDSLDSSRSLDENIT